jgi:hypothetical protein
MIRSRFSQRPAIAAPLLALLIVCLAPAVSWAQTMVFRNDCHYPVVVQAATVVRGRVYRHKPHLLRCNDVSEPMKMAGDMVISVYDGKMPNRVLFQGALRSSRAAMYFVVKPYQDPATGKVVPGKVRVLYRDRPGNGGRSGGMGGPKR